MEHERQAAEEMLGAAQYEFSATLPLPSHIQFLLEAHVAVEQSLLVHMATSGAPAAEWHDEGTERCLRIPNIINYNTLKPMVERTLRRSFTLIEFKRLVWIWSHAPGSRQELDTSPSPPPLDMGGMGFLVSRMRMIDPNTRRQALDYGLGIEMRVPELRSYSSLVTFGSPQNKASPGRQRQEPLRPPSSPSSREEMSNLAVWNNGVDQRRTEFHRRLCHLVAAAHDRWLEHQIPERNEPVLSPVPKPPSTPRVPTGYRTANGLLTPTATRSGGTHAQRIRHDAPATPPASPLADLGASKTPCTPPQSGRRPSKRPMLFGWHPDFALDLVSPIPQAKLPTLHIPPPAAPIRTQNNAAPVPTTTNMTLEERIRAKEQALQAAHNRPSFRTAAPTLHERSMLSRLGELADAIYLLYVSSNVPTQARQGRTTRILPLHEVLSSLEKSAKVAMSRAESNASVAMLMKIAPGWLERTEVGGQPWLRLCNDPQSFGLRHVREKIAQAKCEART